MKSYFNILVYVSFLFIAYKLYQADYLKIPEIQNGFYLIPSFVTLFIGMIASTFNWGAVIKTKYSKVVFKDGLISIGLSIFTKYIPGKILMILGRAEYISEKYSIPRKETSTLSLITQLITVWIGMGLGILGLFKIGKVAQFQWSYISIAFWLFFSVLIFSPGLTIIINFAGKLIGKRQFSVPRLYLKETLNVLPYFIVNWFFWCCSFFFLCKALLTDGSVHPVSGLAFALAGTLGIISVITPGGLGVREGVIAGFLMLLDISLENATTIAVTSRLWFLVGEVFIFITAFYLKNRKI